jgi:hypothetical protein
MKEWIHKCDNDSEHFECHTNSIQNIPPTKLTVIDVKEMCVAEWKQSGPYVALSYVWGRTPNFELKLANLDELLQPRSLEHRWKEIPQTIRDAILLTTNLGFRYLWVDSLCIIQDDWENKFNDINQMASIYGCASITIAAADGSDASHGLRGTGESPRCTAPQEILDLAPDCRIAFSIGSPLEVHKKIYFARFWTYQEYQLSPRLLVFIGDKVRWNCRTHERSEECQSPNNHTKLPYNQFTMKMTWPCLKVYSALVWQYNSRIARDDDDVLAAFSGILGAIVQHFPADFLHGLPELYFDIALLWQPEKPLRRRRPADGHHSIPSWSWTG